MKPVPIGVRAHTAALRGVIAATVTPLCADLTPDLGEAARHCRRLLDAGCDGVAPIGSVGEGPSLSVAERVALLDALAHVLPSGDHGV